MKESISVSQLSSITALSLSLIAGAVNNCCQNFSASSTFVMIFALSVGIMLASYEISLVFYG